MNAVVQDGTPEPAPGQSDTALRAQVVIDALAEHGVRPRAEPAAARR